LGGRGAVVAGPFGPLVWENPRGGGEEKGEKEKETWLKCGGHEKKKQKESQNEKKKKKRGRGRRTVGLGTFAYGDGQGLFEKWGGENTRKQGLGAKKWVLSAK